MPYYTKVKKILCNLSYTQFDLLYELYRTLENQDDYLEHNDFSLENCDFSLENCDFSLENCDFSLENNDFSLENNDDSLMNNENSLMNNENSLMNNENSLMKNENSLMKNENSLMIDDDSLLSSHWKLSFPRCSASLPFYSLWYKTFVVIKAAKLQPYYHSTKVYFARIDKMHHFPFRSFF